MTVVSPFVLHLPEAGDSVFHSSGSPWWVAYAEWGDILTKCLFTDLPLVYSQISQHKEPYCALNRNTEVPILLQRSPLIKRFMAASSIWNHSHKAEFRRWKVWERNKNNSHQGHGLSSMGWTLGHQKGPEGFRILNASVQGYGKISTHVAFPIQSLVSANKKWEGSDFCNRENRELAACQLDR